MRSVRNTAFDQRLRDRRRRLVQNFISDEHSEFDKWIAELNIVITDDHAYWSAAAANRGKLRLPLYVSALWWSASENCSKMKVKLQKYKKED